jgi:hypothetical protein
MNENSKQQQTVFLLTNQAASGWSNQRAAAAENETTASDREQIRVAIPSFPALKHRISTGDFQV